jgi:hypothetical protein
MSKYGINQGKNTTIPHLKYFKITMEKNRKRSRKMSKKKIMNLLT